MNFLHSQAIHHSQVEGTTPIAFWNFSYELQRCTIGFAALIEFPLDQLQKGFSARQIDPSAILQGIVPLPYTFSELSNFNIMTGTGRVKKIAISVFTTADTIVWQVTEQQPTSHQLPLTPFFPFRSADSSARVTDQSSVEMVKAKNRGKKPWQQKVTKFTLKKITPDKKPKSPPSTPKEKTKEIVSKEEKEKKGKKEKGKEKEKEKGNNGAISVVVTKDDKEEMDLVSLDLGLHMPIPPVGGFFMHTYDAHNGADHFLVQE